MKKKAILFSILLPLFCTSCLIKQPKEEIIYNYNVETTESATAASTVEIAPKDDKNVKEQSSEAEKVITDNYTQETLEFDQLIKEISDQTQE